MNYWKIEAHTSFDKQKFLAKHKDFRVVVDELPDNDVLLHPHSRRFLCVEWVHNHNDNPIEVEVWCDGELWFRATKKLPKETQKVPLKRQKGR